MQINESLNIVLPVRSDDKGPILSAYHHPISRDVFEANYRTLSATKAALAGKGAQYLIGVGPQIAALELREQGRKDAAERGDFDGQGNPLDGGVGALLSELKRLTTVLAPTAGGWEQLPVDVAIQKGVMDQDEWKELEAKLAFFTCQYALASRSDRAAIVQATASILGAQTTSLSSMEWIGSLKNSTENDPSPKAVSSVPS